MDKAKIKVLKRMQIPTFYNKGSNIKNVLLVIREIIFFSAGGETKKSSAP